MNKNNRFAHPPYRQIIFRISCELNWTNDDESTIILQNKIDQKDKIEDKIEAELLTKYWPN
jgi:hypothetical protein